jgi:hypothetical protein
MSNIAEIKQVLLLSKDFTAIIHFISLTHVLFLLFMIMQIHLMITHAPMILATLNTLSVQKTLEVIVVYARLVSLEMAQYVKVSMTNDYTSCFHTPVKKGISKSLTKFCVP